MFSSAWDGRYPQISRSWQANWANLATFFAYPTDIQGDLHDQRHRVAEQRDPACNQETEGVPDKRLGEKGGMAGNPSGITEIDNAAEGLAYGNEPLYYRVR